MDMLFHYTQENKSVKKLMDLLGSQLAWENVITSKSFSEIDRHLDNHSDSLKVAMFCVSQTEEIEQLLLLKNKLNGTHLILIMPQRHSDSLKLTHRLHPLLTCFADGDYSEVTGLIRRLNEGDTFMPIVKGGDGNAFFSIWDEEVLF